ncbi:hypothetical protein Pmani_005151 [Petrolisthes manimaculis]|uniref:Uncharacterized protein n=1 Tax=Petrolisthes manimaculis TaxID=1843537 RepID=A0AAE1QEB3_9EUCA|nr:hypothetical protein Pmani_005151 [Petrolisthes manimaculis]
MPYTTGTCQTIYPIHNIPSLQILTNHKHHPHPILSPPHTDPSIPVPLEDLHQHRTSHPFHTSSFSYSTPTYPSSTLSYDPPSLYSVHPAYPYP